MKIVCSPPAPTTEAKNPHSSATFIYDLQCPRICCDYLFSPSAGISSGDGGFLPTIMNTAAGFPSYLSVCTCLVTIPSALIARTSSAAIAPSCGTLVFASSTDTPESNQGSGPTSRCFHPAFSSDCRKSAPKLD